MGSFGERLRREREMRGITIEEIAEATKIGTRNLRALEEEKFDLLPGGIFNKGFVRAYSKFLGLDEEQAVADYISAETSFRTADEPEVPVERSSESSKALLAAVVLLIVIAGAGFGGWKFYKNRMAQRAAVQAAAVQPVAPTAAPTPVATTVDPNAQPAATPVSDTNPSAQPTAATSPASSPANTPAVIPASTMPAPETVSADGFMVHIKAKEDSWVSAKADGKSVLSGTLKAANEKTLHAKDRIILTLGNAAGVQVTYNGKDLDLGNAAGQVKKLVFTPQGLQPDAPEQR
jgi:cytoskeleton protein RodZ